VVVYICVVNKGNNKINELRTILQRESQKSQLYKQTKSNSNRKTEKSRNDRDLVQAFLKKWWVESDFKVLYVVVYICVVCGRVFLVVSGRVYKCCKLSRIYVL
jgi:hypothetical protein